MLLRLREWSFPIYRFLRFFVRCHLNFDRFSHCNLLRVLISFIQTSSTRWNYLGDLVKRPRFHGHRPLTKIYQTLCRILKAMLKSPWGWQRKTKARQSLEGFRKNAKTPRNRTVQMNSIWNVGIKQTHTIIIVSVTEVDCRNIANSREQCGAQEPRDGRDAHTTWSCKHGKSQDTGPFSRQYSRRYLPIDMEEIQHAYWLSIMLVSSLPKPRALTKSVEPSSYAYGSMILPKINTCINGNSFTVTQNQILNALEKATVDQFSVTQNPVDNLREEWARKPREGNSSSMPDIIASVFHGVPWYRRLGSLLGHQSVAERDIEFGTGTWTWWFGGTLYLKK